MAHRVELPPEPTPAVGDSQGKRGVDKAGGRFKVMQLSAGATHCAVLSTVGCVCAWGGNAAGQVGAGSPERSCPIPSLVFPPPPMSDGVSSSDDDEGDRHDAPASADHFGRGSSAEAPPHGHGKAPARQHGTKPAASANASRCTHSSLLCVHAQLLKSYFVCFCRIDCGSAAPMVDLQPIPSV
jgi:hypothetical protein